MKFWPARSPGNVPPPHPGTSPRAPVLVVAATRLSEAEFWRASNLGASIGKARLDHQLDWRITFDNRNGLPAVYNHALRSVADEVLLVFVHDDVFVYDYFLALRINEALARFDLIGVVGHPAPDPRHVGWGAWRPANVTTGFEIDQAPKSGAIEHSPGAGMELTYFGPAPQPVKLLDGMFLAARAGTLRQHGVAFDERFDFHFYDLDFCRTCLAAGLSLGTWPIALSHASLGAFGTPAWEAGLAAYRNKWSGREL